MWWLLAIWVNTCILPYCLSVVRFSSTPTSKKNWVILLGQPTLLVMDVSRRECRCKNKWTEKGQWKYTHWAHMNWTPSFLFSGLSKFLWQLDPLSLKIYFLSFSLIQFISHWWQSKKISSMIDVSSSAVLPADSQIFMENRRQMQQICH